MRALRAIWEFLGGVVCFVVIAVGMVVFVVALIFTFACRLLVYSWEKRK